MSRSAAVLLLAALVTLASCFQYTPKDCQVLCPLNNTGGCPGMMDCQAQAGLPDGVGICAAKGAMCPPIADSGVTPTDSGTPDARDAGGSQPPTMLCHNGACFTLPDSVRSNLVLLLWPSNLPPVGSTVSLWADQSGKGNDAHALDPSALPQVISDGVHLAPADGTGLVVVNGSSLDFGSGDFALIVVEGLASGATPVSLIKKTDGVRTNSHQMGIDWVLSSATTGRPQGTVDDTAIMSNTDVPQPGVAAYSLYRSTDHVQLRVNDTVVGSADLSAGATTTNSDDLYIGVGSTVGSPADSIEAVIAIRGTIGSTELTQLESFLRDLFTK